MILDFSIFRKFVSVLLLSLVGMVALAQNDGYTYDAPNPPLILNNDKIKFAHALETQVGLTRFEKYHSFSYLLKCQSWEFRTGVGYGVVKTLFQNRFFPQGILGVSYNSINASRFQLGPTIVYSISGYTYNRAAHAKVIYHDLFIGAQLFYGKKWLIGTRLAVGASLEQLVDIAAGGRTWAPNYYGELTLRYAL